MLEKLWFLNYLKDLFCCGSAVWWFTQSHIHLMSENAPIGVWCLWGVWCQNLPNQKCRPTCSGDPWWIWEQLKAVVCMSLGKLQRLPAYHTKTKKHFKLESPVNQRSLSVDCMRETHACRHREDMQEGQSWHQWHSLHQQHRDTWIASSPMNPNFSVVGFAKKPNQTQHLIIISSHF